MRQVHGAMHAKEPKARSRGPDRACASAEPGIGRGREPGPGAHFERGSRRAGGLRSLRASGRGAVPVLCPTLSGLSGPSASVSRLSGLCGALPGQSVRRACVGPSVPVPEARTDLGSALFAVRRLLATSCGCPRRAWRRGVTRHGARLPCTRADCRDLFRCDIRPDLRSRIWTMRRLCTS